MFNYFELLDLEQKYDIDLKILDKQYFAMQLKYHPDRAKIPEEKLNSLAISTQLNKAYQTLKDDLKRAEYLLSLNNVILDEEKIRKSMSREQLSDIWSDLELVDMTEGLKELEDILDNKIIEQQQFVKSLSLAYQNQNIQSALEITIKLKYLKNLISNIQLKIKSCK
ncbi:MAG: co-chaperone HscB [Rickettsia endosymbiont of Bryobia graminum]|nr:co-chaperone HscB [Rickettsia endosymbiont of Bryobia graminum]